MPFCFRILSFWFVRYLNRERPLLFRTMNASHTRTRFFVGLETSNGLEIHPEEVINLIRSHVEAGTFYEGKGLWHGELENSIVFESVGLEDCFRDSEEAVSSAEGLKELLEEEFEQDSVMVEKAGVEAGF